MAIDPKELRIGSHIDVNGVRARVTKIDEPKSNEIPPYVILCFTAVIDGELREAGGFPHDDKINPIPITPELLKEIGFKYHEYDNGKLWELDFPDLYKAYLYLEFDEDTTSIYNFRMWNMKEYEIYGRVQTLHELENWIYLMYGKELIND